MASRVLLADDSATVLKTVSQMLADEGIDVVTVSDGEQARTLLDSSGADLVIAGLSLYGLSGEELCHYVKSTPRLRHIPVVLLVGAFERLNHTVGADAELAKPPASRQLTQTLRRLIEKSDRAPRPSLPFEMRPDGETPSESRPERIRGQSTFFKPYIPPPDLTAEQPSLEVRALPVKAQTGNLDRKPERIPEGASVLLMTIFAVIAVVGLAFWFLTRSSQTAPENLRAGEQLSSVEGKPVADAAALSRDEIAANQPASTSEEAAVSDEAADAVAGSHSDEEYTVAQPQDSVHPIESASERISRGAQEGAARNEASQNGRAAIAPSLIREQMLARARSYEDRGMIADAELQYRAVLHNFPGDQTSRFALSRLAAIAESQRREQGGRESRDAGLRAFLAGNYATAVESLTAALNAGRGDTVVLYSLGTSQWKLGRNGEAQRSFERCLVANPNYAPAMVGLAEVKASAGKRSEAVALLNRALQLGGGAEYSPERIREMISRYTPRAASRP